MESFESEIVEESSATKISEVVGRILAFLSPSDLISCTLVNSVWEAEARSHLKKVPSKRLCCSQVYKYFEDTNPRGRPHAALRLTTCSQKDCLGILVDKLREENCLQHVTSLFTDWTPDVEWGTELQFWKLFTNLQTLELRPCFGRTKSTETCNFRLEALNYLRQYTTRDFTFPVHTLIWNLSKLKDNENHWEIPLRALIAPTGNSIFPNVSTLKFSKVNLKCSIIHEVMYTCSRHFPKMNHLSIPILKRCVPAFRMDEFTLNLNKISVTQLNRLELSILNNTWEKLLVHFAPTLEHVSLRGVKSIHYHEEPHKPHTLAFPIMPRLRVFKLLRVPFQFRTSNPTLCRHPDRQVSALKLKFHTSEGCIVDYSTQFPSLVRLELGNEEVEPSEDMLPNDEHTDFDTWLPFLYESFLPPPSSQQGLCTTLRLLRIPTPPKTWEKDFSFEPCPDCPYSKFKRSQGQIKSCWEKGTEFFQRVSATFPNLDNMSPYKY